MIVLYYIFILIIIIYLLFFRTIEGMYTLPNTYINEAQPSNTLNMFGFYKGKGVYKKNYISSEKNKEKISLLNSLLDRLLNRIVNNNQNCIGEFSEYSECDKSCGEGGVQKRTYKIIQEKGKNGESCKHEDGYEETINCPLDYCLLDDLCETNKDCESKNCGIDSGRCEEYIPCDKNNLHGCDQDQCRQLNEDYSNASHMLEGKYLYDLTSESCFFKTPAEVEELNLDIYTYNFRSLSKKAKELGLECNWYQQKNKDTKICENYPNIVVNNDNNEVKCLDNWGPQPTFFNASNSCNECKITESEEENIVNFDYGNCRCSSGKLTPNNDSYTCKVSGVTNQLCEDTNEENYEFKIQNVGGDCISCDDNEYLLYQNNNATCLPCPDNSSHTNASITLENDGYRQLCNESQEVNCGNNEQKIWDCRFNRDARGILYDLVAQARSTGDVDDRPECQSCPVKKINISLRTYKTSIADYDSGGMEENNIFKIEGINKSLYGNEREFYSDTLLSGILVKFIFIQNTAFSDSPDYDVSNDLLAYTEDGDPSAGGYNYQNDKSINYQWDQYQCNSKKFSVKNNSNNDMYICIFNNYLWSDRISKNLFDNKLLNIILKDSNGYRPSDILTSGCSPNNPANHCPCLNYENYIKECNASGAYMECELIFGEDYCNAGGTNKKVGKYIVDKANELVNASDSAIYPVAHAKTHEQEAYSLYTYNNNKIKSECPSTAKWGESSWGYPPGTIFEHMWSGGVKDISDYLINQNMGDNKGEPGDPSGNNVFVQLSSEEHGTVSQHYSNPTKKYLQNLGVPNLNWERDINPAFYKCYRLSDLEDAVRGSNCPWSYLKDNQKCS